MRDLFLFTSSRLGSTRVKGKILRPFAGTTLLDLTIKRMRTLQDDRVFSGIGWAVSRDDKELWERVGDSGIPVIERQHVSAVGAPEPKVLYEYLARVDAEHVMWINDSMPLFSPHTIRRMCRAFRADDEIKSMTAVLKRQGWFWHPSGVPINNLDPAEVSTQHCPPIYETVHGAHIFPKANPLHHNRYWNLEPKDPGLYVIRSEIEATDIDSDDQFLIAEEIYRRVVGDAISEDRS
ncbi:hypothetical protein LCGC14_0624250 [marine sediment metagenome]|uniref:MobA-like NTP transferase domain-containing protein n=1 Tax=marine sediment metagenome TaxID=412755 RepID=A0A0F9R8Y3_9ZZZZ